VQLEMAQLEEIMSENGMIGRAVAERRRRMMEYGNINLGGRQYAGQMFVIRIGPNGEQIINAIGGRENNRVGMDTDRRRENFRSDSSSDE